VASTAVAPAASPAPARVDVPEASPQPAPVEPAPPRAVKPAPSAAAGGAGNRVRPKEDPDALQRIESAIERASAEGAKETARKRVPERPN
ncbi:MAG: hypothetical protein K2W80_12260, partial [Burkholderiales bacterium]|nr:hypothetical protein [Burkholderiales bacterium]